MSNPMNMTGVFDPETVAEIFNKVRGFSSLSTLCSAAPIPFTGSKEFTFELDSEADIVGESAAKSHGGLTAAPVTVRPYKFEYGARVSDEFMNASEEERLDILSNFIDGCAKKFASGFDQAAFHGINPRSGSASAVVGTNHFDNKITATVTYASATADDSIDEAIGKVEAAERDVTGIVLAPAVRSDLAAMRSTAGNRLYPEFAFGGTPPTLGSQRLSVNRTVAVGGTDKGIVGDFANAFKWGYAKQMNFEIIPYGNPDNSDNGDLKGHNQIYLRCEAYIGWGILDAASFCRLV